MSSVDWNGTTVYGRAAMTAEDADEARTFWGGLDGSDSETSAKSRAQAISIGTPETARSSRGCATPTQEAPSPGLGATPGSSVTEGAASGLSPSTVRSSTSCARAPVKQGSVGPSSQSLSVLGDGSVAPSCEFLAAVDSDSSELVKALAQHIHPMSLDEQLPRGMQNAALTKIRNTINLYTLRLCKEFWVSDVKSPTMLALKQRLFNHSHDVQLKASTNVQVMFRNLQDRLTHFIELWKITKRWLDQQKVTIMPEALPHFEYIANFMTAVNQDFAGDLKIMRWHCQAMSLACQFKPMAPWMETISLEEWAACRGSIALAAKPQQAQNDSPDGTEGVAGAGEGSSSTAASERIAKRRRHTTCDAEMTKVLHMHEDVLTQIGFMLSEAFRCRISLMIINANTVREFVDASQAALDVYEGWVKASGTEKDAAVSVLSSTIMVMACECGEHYNLRPSQVRSARKLLFDEAGSKTSLYSQLARGIIMSAHCQAVLGKARAFASKGLQDEAALTMMKKSGDDLEDTLADLYVDTDKYFWGLRDDGAYTLDVTKFLADSSLALPHTACVTDCIGRLTGAAVETGADDVVFQMDNLLVIVEIGAALICRIALERVQRMGNTAPTLSAAGELRLQSLEASGETAALASTEEHAVVESPVTAGERIMEYVSSEQQIGDLRILGQKLIEMTQGVDTVMNALQTANGADWRNGLGAREPGTKVLVQKLEQNQACVFELVKFSHAVEYLNGVGTIDGSRTANDAALNARGQYMTALSEFAQVYGLWTSRACAIVTFSTAAEPTEADKIATHLREHAYKVFSGAGKALYDTHIKSAIVRWITAIAKQPVVPVLANKANIETLPFSQLTSQLVSAPSHDDLVDLAVVLTRDDGSIDFSQEAWTHWPSFLQLRDLCAQLKIPSLVVPLVTDGATEDKLCVTAEVLFCLHSTCVLKDVAVSFALANEFLTRQECTKSMDMQAMKSRFVPILQFLRTKVSDLDLNTACAMSAQVGASSVQTMMPCTCATLTHWQMLMATMVLRFVHQVMFSCHEFVQQETKSVKEGLPVWRSCVTAEDLNLEIAAGVVAGKYEQVVSMHNALHNALATIAGIANSLDVTPPPAEHAITRSGIAEAVATLRDAKLAGVVCKGIDILGDCAAQQGDLAKKFVQQFKEKYGEVSELKKFWRSLEEAAQYAGTAISKAGPVQGADALVVRGTVPKNPSFDLDAASTRPSLRGSAASQDVPLDGASASSAAGGRRTLRRKRC